MYTFEMVGVADENGKTYECKYGTYSLKDGYKPNEAALPIVKEKGWREIVNILFHENIWKLKQPPVKEMSLQDIERELGYRVRITDENKDKEKLDDTIDFFRRWFGIDLDEKNYEY